MQSDYIPPQFIPDYRDSGLLGRKCIWTWEACDGWNDCYSNDETSHDEEAAFCDALPEATCADDEVGEGNMQLRNT